MRSVIEEISKQKNWTSSDIIGLKTDVGGGKSIHLLNWAIHANKRENLGVLFILREDTIDNKLGMHYRVLTGDNKILSTDELESFKQELINRNNAFMYQYDFSANKRLSLDGAVKSYYEKIKKYPELIVLDSAASFYDGVALREVCTKYGSIGLVGIQTNSKSDYFVDELFEIIADKDKRLATYKHTKSRGVNKVNDIYVTLELGTNRIIN